MPRAIRFARGRLTAKMISVIDCGDRFIEEVFRNRRMADQPVSTPLAVGITPKSMRRVTSYPVLWIHLKLNRVDVYALRLLDAHSWQWLHLEQDCSRSEEQGSRFRLADGLPRKKLCRALTENPLH